tara:strand:+ start:276 stop:434 length:159 start_codon:yes stop_codon:yes gene_type:complete
MELVATVSLLLLLSNTEMEKEEEGRGKRKRMATRDNGWRAYQYFLLGHRQIH